VQVRPDGEDLLALDQHVGLDEVTYRRSIDVTWPPRMM